MVTNCILRWCEIRARLNVHPRLLRADKSRTAAGLQDREWLHASGELALFFLVWWWMTASRLLVWSDLRALRPSDLFSGLAYWWLWVVVCQPLSTLVRRYPIERPHRWRRVALYALLGPLPTLVHGVLQFVVVQPFPEIAPRRLGPSLAFDVTYGQLVYWVLLALKHASHYYRATRDAEIRTARLEEDLAQARIDAVRVAIQPDLVVARLRDIAAQLRRDPASADDRVVRLGRYLRRKLDRTAESVWAAGAPPWSPPPSPGAAVAAREGWFNGTGEILLLVSWNVVMVGSVLGGWYAVTFPRIPLQALLERGGNMSIHGALWAVVCIPLGALVERWPIEAPDRVRRLIGYSGLGLLLGAMHASLHFTVARALLASSAVYLAPSFRFTLCHDLSIGQTTFGIFLFVKHVWFFRRRSRVQLARAAELRAQLAVAQLRALQMQLHPHFLFNALHSISELVHDDPTAAEEMTVRLADLLQQAFEGGTEQFVTLGRELVLLERYLGIQKIRFQDRLVTEIDVVHDLRSLHVPNFMLQPLVENAIKHGIARRLEGGCVRVRCSRSGDSLAIEVADESRDLNGAALSLPTASQTGLGLRNTESRLRHLYGRCYDLRLERNERGGATTFLTIPVIEGEASADN